MVPPLTWPWLRSDSTTSSKTFFFMEMLVNWKLLCCTSSLPFNIEGFHSILFYSNGFTDMGNTSTLLKCELKSQRLKQNSAHHIESERSPGVIHDFAWPIRFPSKSQVWLLLVHWAQVDTKWTNNSILFTFLYLWKSSTECAPVHRFTLFKKRWISFKK